MSDETPASDRRPSAANRDTVPVIAIGASAGGLDPLKDLLGSIPENVAACIVIVSHRAPAAPSALAELLARYTHLPVGNGSDGLQLLPGTAWVIPAGKAVSFQEGTLHLWDIEERERFSPIDQMFRALSTLGERAIGIVLSGSGSDGSVGVKDVKAAGGVVLVQDPPSARYPSMPEATIASIPADHVLPPADLGRIAFRLAALITESEQEPLRPEVPSKRFVDRVLAALLDATGHDFTSYKRSTVTRRIVRRMQILEVDHAERYLDLVHERPSELELLFSELLIGVTSFFRDPDVFDALQEVLTRYIEQLAPGTELRIWVPACSTGEEAYSLAIVIHECLKKIDKKPAVQIFATDLDPRAVQFARTGRYPAAVAADISPERLQEYFVADDASFRVSKEIREMLVFAPQNLTRDPPFTRIDLLSCRNMLIYLEPELQQKILTLFHYALLPKGLLLLGTSESLGALHDAFTAVDKKHKIFANRESVPGQRLIDLQLLDIPTTTKPSVQEPGSPPHRTYGIKRGIGLVADRVLLTNLVPPSVLITERGEIAYIHGRTGRFLEPAAGEPNANVFDMAREGLRLELPAAIRQAALRRVPVVRHGLQVRTNGAFEQVNLTVRPLAEPDAVAGLLLVTFEAKGPAEHPGGAPEAESVSSAVPGDRAVQLESELQHVRENLQGTIEELETSNEELKSTNEELQSTNEELQSTNEELETSREEMQSLNEELQTLNAELQDRNEELSQINDDMQNLLNSTDVATVFLDGELNIKRFTVPAKKVFHLRDSDIGRPLSDMAANLRYERFIEDAQQVLASLVYIEREVRTSEGDWRLMRILPYRTAQNVIDGLIITFLGIDRFKQAEADATHARVFGERVADTLRDGLVVLDAEYRIISVNPAFCRNFGYSVKALIGEPLDALGAGFSHPELCSRLDELAEGRAFTPLRLKGNFGRRRSDVVVTGFDLAEAANGARFVLMLEELGTRSYPEPVEFDES